MTMAATALALLLAQGQPLPPGHPPLNGGAFEIAPPTPMQARPDLAPPPVDEPTPRSP